MCINTCDLYGSDMYRCGATYIRIPTPHCKLLAILCVLCSVTSALQLFSVALMAVACVRQLPGRMSCVTHCVHYTDPRSNESRTPCYAGKRTATRSANQRPAYLFTAVYGNSSTCSFIQKFSNIKHFRFHIHKVD